MSNVSHIASSRLDRASEIIVIVPLKLAILIDGKCIPRIELRDARGGLSAANACEAAGGKPTDRAVAALSRMAGLTFSQIMAMRTEDMTRALAFAAAAIELERED